MDDSGLRALVIEFARSRAAGKTFCPSEVARATGESEWRRLMPGVREAAFALADEGVVVVMQRGQVVDGRTVRGPLRIAAAPPGARRGSG